MGRTRTITLMLPDGQAPGRTTTVPLPERYSAPALLGHGGMGEVWAVHDRVLDRVVALKVLSPAAWDEPDIRRRFLEEARILALLEHPDIVAIHDRGELVDGAPFYTMRRVRGDVLDAVPGSPNDRLQRWIRTAEAVAYAHSRGVVHRDLKPSNVMIGAFNEVQLMDWGIAWERGTDLAPLVGGSPGYTAPEQERGATPTPAVDCFALGRMLARLVDTRGALGALVEQATAPDPAARPDARALVDAVREVAEGKRRRREALRRVEEADALAHEAEALHAQRSEMVQTAARMLARLPTPAPASAKVEAWRLQDAAQEASVQAALLETRSHRRLAMAMHLDDALPEAHARLAAFHRVQLLDAEARHDAEGVARHTELLRSHGSEEDRAWLVRGGTVSLHTTPAGASVTAAPYVVRDRRLVPAPSLHLGTTPLDRVALDRGSWLLQIEHPDCEPVRYPIALGRGEHWHGRDPEGQGVSILLPERGSIDPRCRYVPAGWFQSGDQDRAAEALSPRRLWVDGFLVRRDPVTQGEYAAFLSALVASDRDAEAEERLPRTPAGEPMQRRSSVGYVPVGDPALPVVGLRGVDAWAFCRWLGPGWRLPHDQEWEKAARGTDARPLPWGTHDEPTWTRIAASVRPPALAPVDALVHDVGPYDVRGMAGNASDWCANPFDRDGPTDGSRVIPVASPIPGLTNVRGGYFLGGTGSVWLATRLAADLDRRLSGTSLRPVRSVN